MTKTIMNCIVVLLFLMMSCSSEEIATTPGESLTERAQSFYELMNKKDFLEAHKYYSPAIREICPNGEFALASNMALGMLEGLLGIPGVEMEMSVESVEIDGNTGQVFAKVEFSKDGDKVDFGDSNEGDSARWELIDDEWWAASNDCGIFGGGATSDSEMLAEQYNDQEAYGQWVNNEYEACIQTLTKAIEVQPNNAQPYYNRALCKEASVGWMWGKVVKPETVDHRVLSDAISDVSKAIELSPEVTNYYYERANLHEGMGNKEQFIADSWTGEYLCRTHHEAKVYLCGRGWDFLYDANPYIATPGPSPTPNPVVLAEMYFWKAIGHWDNREYGKCSQTLTKLVELLPDKGEVYYNRAICNLRLEDTDEKHRANHFNWITPYIEYVDNETLLNILGDLDKAIELKQDVGRYYEARGRVHEKLGNNEQAVADIKMGSLLCTKNVKNCYVHPDSTLYE